MQHSVWNWDKVQYDYFQSNTPNSVGGWRPLTGLGVPTRSNVRSRGGVGVDIEAVLPSLPVGAKYIGSGPQAVGQICRRPPPRRYRGFTGLGFVDPQRNVLSPADAQYISEAQLGPQFSRPLASVSVYGHIPATNKYVDVKDLNAQAYAIVAPQAAAYMKDVTPAKLAEERQRAGYAEMERRRLADLDDAWLEKFNQRNAVTFADYADFYYATYRQTKQTIGKVAREIGDIVGDVAGGVADIGAGVAWKVIKPLFWFLLAGGVGYGGYKYWQIQQMKKLAGKARGLTP